MNLQYVEPVHYWFPLSQGWLPTAGLPAGNTQSLATNTHFSPPSPSQRANNSFVSSKCARFSHLWCWRNQTDVLQQSSTAWIIVKVCVTCSQRRTARLRGILTGFGNHGDAWLWCTQAFPDISKCDPFLSGEPAVVCVFNINMEATSDQSGCCFGIILFATCHDESTPQRHCTRYSLVEIKVISLGCGGRGTDATLWLPLRSAALPWTKR